ncbi:MULTISPECIES: anchored repeat ABC transporter, substrate-binding protein [Winkia]|uniref:anchored repeat ABC transporter, substrate-binding protein n=1 Tax=Winkia TaxID=2692118 RepID=UPI000C7173D0|nr:MULTISPECIES: anchored repeat ABC transporter, substrate-binding protein [Winkia]PLB81399.1 anchored repeat ABC transporter, substrate-binding protein [Actinomyces sp. UMB0138]MDK7162412.1 anchored repeat ABC transporter, substrate-binding protein [Winkia sp. UMB3105]MDK8594353.1 anchored repeat ABC transporter, substrate-binding protein [Winkia sp. UMB1096A]MDU2269014.1 anchored repeat ABC transporter, substrate-binding protein [Winkia neuii]WEB56201.1 anchored repeat ABC transporter, subs
MRKLIAVVLLCCCACSPAAQSKKPQVVATTPVLADIAQNVAGTRAQVKALVKPGADPHSYEPTLADVRAIANSKLALTNHLLLEEQSLYRAVRNNSRGPVIKVGEETPKYGTRMLPLVEDITLNTVWLGMRVDGTTARMQMTARRGPGDVSAYLTTSFGSPQVYLNSADGIDQRDGVDLPAGAHTHMSWAFTKPGIYQIDFAAKNARNTITFAVGVDPARSELTKNMEPLTQGHEDITLKDGKILIVGDAKDGRNKASFDPTKTVIVVPPAALEQIPPDPRFRFLGRPGHETYMLAQAVIGKHVHGEVDPHMWQDVQAGIAYAKVIRDHLKEVDPAGSATYDRNTRQYEARLKKLDEYVRGQIRAIPKAQRHLVTTHDAYGYLGKAYGINVAGFVSPNPAVEPSSRDLVALTRTLQNLHVKAVFLEPNLSARSKDLTETAKRLHIAICPIHGDTFTEEINTYEKMMAANADSLRRCLEKK